MPPNESCPVIIGESGALDVEEDFVFYSIGFGLRPLDLLMPDHVQKYELASIKFSQYFTDLPHQVQRNCTTKLSPEQIISILEGRPAANLLVARTVGVIRPGVEAKKLSAHFAKVSQGKHGAEHYFTIGLSQRTWNSHEAVAIQISGMCPLANRQQEDAEALFAKQARVEERVQAVKIGSEGNEAAAQDKEVDFLDMAVV